MAEIAAGAGVAWARRDGVGVPVAAVVPGVAVSVALAVGVPSALSVLTALVPVDAAVLFSTGSAVAFVSAQFPALPASSLEVSACACCSAVA